MTDPVPAGEYHERTKHTPTSVRTSGLRLDWANEPTPYKTYVDRPSVPLADAIRPAQVPTLRAIAGTGPPFEGERRPDLDAVTQLCYLSAGVTKVVERAGREHRFRAAACTGALYHVDLYLVSGDLPGAGGSPGLDAGVYHFDPLSLSLDVLRRGDYRGALAAAAGADGTTACVGGDDAATGRADDAGGVGEGRASSPDGEPGVASAPLSVVATSTWWRNAWKYGERTYRHAFWDSGTVLANLLAVAHALGYPARVATGFADRAVATLLGVDPAEEGSVALVPVGHVEDSLPESPPVEPIDPATEPLSPDPVHYDTIEGAYAASSLPDGAAVREWRAGAPEGAVGGRGPVDGDGRTDAGDEAAGSGDGAAGAGDGQRVDLVPVGDERAAKTPLHWTVRRRGSCRAYERDELSVRKVSTVLDRATRGAPMDVRPPGAPPLQYVDAYAIVHAVEGVEPGVYQYHPTGLDHPDGGEPSEGGDRPAAGEPSEGGDRPAAGELELLRAGRFRAEAEHLALDQALAGDAALCLFFLADLDAVTDVLGDRGYRVAQLEAALAAGRLYLAAYAHRDLGATGLTFYDDAVTEFLSPRAAGQTPTFLWTLGRPA